MRALQVNRHGEPLEVLSVNDVEVPEPGPGEVLVKVAAAALNFNDILRCQGGLVSVPKQPPFTLGMDVCGTVEAAGEGAEQWIGQRVVGVSKDAFGGIAEYTTAPASGVFGAPPSLDDEAAAAFLLPFHTTYLALRRARLERDETLLVVGGASSLGTAAVQLGAAAGAHVIAVAGGPAKTELCRKLGAEHAIDHHDGDVFDQVMAHTGGRGADVVVDLVGGDGTELVWTCVAYEGRYVPVGFNADPEGGFTGRPLRKVSMGNFSVVGVMLAYLPESVGLRQFGLVPNPPERGTEIHGALCGLVAEGAIRPHVGRRIGLGQVAAALEDHEQRRTSGRTVVDLSLPVDAANPTDPSDAAP